MAETKFARSTYAAYDANYHANLIEKKWSRKLFKHGLAVNPLKAFIGTGDNSIVQIKQDLKQGKGDQIIFTLRALLSGDGQGDDGVHEGNEEADVYYDESVVVHERGHATKVAGIMTEQRTSIPLRKSGRDSLGEWKARANAADIVAALTGTACTVSFAGQATGEAATDVNSSAIETVNSSTVIGSGGRLSAGADGGRYFYGGQNAAGTLFYNVASDSAITLASAATMRFGVKVITKCRQMAEATISSTGLVINPIRPVLVNGGKHFVMFISPHHAKDLRVDTVWIAAQKDAQKRGKNNPLFTGAMGMWDNVIIHVLHLIHFRYGINGTASSEHFFSSDDVCASSVYVARALFCGAQAALLAYGKMPTWKEKMFDYGAKWGLSTRMIYGTKKASFNGIPFGCIVCDTAIDPSG